MVGGNFGCCVHDLVHVSFWLACSHAAFVVALEIPGIGVNGHSIL